MKELLFVLFFWQAKLPGPQWVLMALIRLKMFNVSFGGTEVLFWRKQWNEWSNVGPFFLVRIYLRNCLCVKCCVKNNFWKNSCWRRTTFTTSFSQGFGNSYWNSPVLKVFILTAAQEAQSCPLPPPQSTTIITVQQLSDLVGLSGHFYKAFKYLIFKQPFQM